MSRIRITKPDGIMPAITPANLPDSAAQTAENVWLKELSLVPLKAPSVVQGVAAGSLSIYPWNRDDVDEWQAWSTDVDVVESPIPDDQWDRIYWTNGTTLHERLRASGVTVNVADVSMTPPAKPTITKTDWFDPDTVTARGAGAACTNAGYSWNGDILTMFFYNPTHEISAYVNAPLQLGVGISLPASDIQFVSDSAVPHDNRDPQSQIFVDTVELSYAGTQFGTFQVIAAAPDPSSYETYPAPATGYTTPFTYIVQVKMNYSRQVTQYKRYIQRNVNAYGQESPDSALSDLVEWTPNDRLTITSHAAAGAVSCYIYRVAVDGNQENDYFFVDEVTPGANFVDDAIDSELEEVKPRIENPPALMYGLKRLPCGSLIAFYGKQAYVSEPELPYSWPTEYRHTSHHDIVGLSVSGNDWYIHTTDGIEIVVGTHPSMMTKSVLPVAQGCASKRSICMGEGWVLYGSPDGLVAGSGGVFNVVTAGHYTREQWQALGYTSLIGSIHDGRFVGFFPATTIIFDFRESGAKRLTTSTELATAAYADPTTDSLYIVQASSLNKWRGSATSLTQTWRGKEQQTILTTILNSAQVIAETYADLTFRLYYDGVLTWSYAVTSNRAFRIPKAARSERWSFAVTGTDVVYEILMAPSMSGLRPGKIHAGPPIVDGG